MALAYLKIMSRREQKGLRKGKMVLIKHRETESGNLELSGSWRVSSRSSKELGEGSAGLGKPPLRPASFLSSDSTVHRCCDCLIKNSTFHKELPREGNSMPVHLSIVHSKMMIVVVVMAVMTPNLH